MSMREKLARAIADQIGYDYDKVFEHKQEWVAEGGMRDGRFHDVNEPYRSDFDCAADAVLDALMEPTPEMIEAGDVPGWDGSVTVGHSAEVWQAMIRAARSKP